MAFTTKPAVSVESGKELSILSSLTRTNGNGPTFTDGDFIILQLPLQLKTIKWENNDPNARTKGGEYPVITHKVFRANGTPYPTPMDIPLSNFASRRAYNEDINGVLHESEGRFPLKSSYVDIWNGLQDLDGQRIQFNPKKYLVYGPDGSKQERRLTAWK